MGFILFVLGHCLLCKAGLFELELLHEAVFFEVDCVFVPYKFY